MKRKTNGRGGGGRKESERERERGRKIASLLTKLPPPPLSLSPFVLACLPIWYSSTVDPRYADKSRK